MTTFVKRLAFVDDRLSTLQILRNDQVFGFLQIMRQKLILGVRDKYRVREQYEEGLKHLINVFEIYKTPITHYQKSYERVCRYIQKELQQKIVSDGGSQTSGSSAGNTSQGNGSQQMLLFQFFEQISKKGSGLFQEIQNKLDVAFGKLEYEDSLRLDTVKKYFYYFWFSMCICQKQMHQVQIIIALNHKMKVKRFYSSQSVNFILC